MSDIAAWADQPGRVELLILGVLLVIVIIDWWVFGPRP
jgi:hypothetical protein